MCAWRMPLDRDEASLTLPRVWRDMSPDDRLAAARVFWADADSIPQQAEAITYLARQLRFRPQSILGLPMERRARQLAMAQKPPDGVIGRALVVFHLGERRPMLEMFLDQLGVAHTDGLIADTLAGPPPEEQVRKAVAAIRAAFPPEAVRLYLRTLAVQDPETWGGLVRHAEPDGPPA